MNDGCVVQTFLSGAIGVIHLTGGSDEFPFSIFAKNSIMKQLQQIINAKTKSPVIVLKVEEYEALIEYMEDLEDRLAILDRADEPDGDFKALVEKLDKKHGIKRKIK